MNRFVWDMRTPDATGFPKIILWAGNLRGPVVPPGNYQVRLTAAGQTLTQSFSVRKNPLLATVSDADLQEQFKLAMQIRDRLSLANQTVVRIRTLKDQIGIRLGKVDKSKDAQIAASADSLVRKLTEIEGEIYQYRNQSSQDPLNYPIRLNNKLAALKGTVEGGDGRPTDQSYVVFKDLSGRLDAQITRLDDVLKNDVPAFNKLVSTREVEPLKIP